MRSLKVQLRAVALLKVQQLLQRPFKAKPGRGEGRAGMWFMHSIPWRASASHSLGPSIACRLSESSTRVQ